MGKIQVGVGIVLVLIGAVWFFQGIGMLGGSPMTGQSFWAIVGSILIIAGILLGLLGARSGPASPPR